MKLSRTQNLNKLASKLGLSKKAASVNGMGGFKPVHLPGTPFIYLVDENGNIATLEDHIMSLPEYDPGTVYRLFGAESWEDLKAKDIDKYNEAKRLQGEAIDNTFFYEDDIQALRDYYYNNLGNPLKGAKLPQGHKFKEGSTPFVIGGDMLASLPFSKKTNPDGTVSTNPIITDSSVYLALEQANARAEALLNQYLGINDYIPQEIVTLDSKPIESLRYLEQQVYDPNTGKVVKLDFSDKDWSSGDNSRPRSHFVPMIQQMAAAAINDPEFTKQIVDPLYREGNLGYVIPNDKGEHVLEGYQSYLDLGSFGHRDPQLALLSLALKDKEAFRNAYEYVSNKRNGVNQPPPTDVNTKVISQLLENNAARFGSYQTDADGVQRFKLNEGVSKLPDILANPSYRYDEDGNYLPYDLISFSRALNEGQDTPLFTDHTNRTFSKNPKFTTRFGESAAAHLLNHDEDGNIVLKGTQNPAYADYSFGHPLMVIQAANFANSEQNAEHRSALLQQVYRTLVEQDDKKLSKLRDDIRSTDEGASLRKQWLLEAAGIDLGGTNWRKNYTRPWFVSEDSNLVLDSTLTNRTNVNSANYLTDKLKYVTPAYHLGSIIEENFDNPFIKALGQGYKTLGTVSAEFINPVNLYNATLAQNTGLGNSGEYFGVGDQQSYGKKHIWSPLEQEFTAAGYSKKDAENYFTQHLGGDVAYLSPQMMVSGESMNDAIGNVSAALTLLPGSGAVIKGIAGQGAKQLARVATGAAKPGVIGNVVNKVGGKALRAPIHPQAQALYKNQGDEILNHILVGNKDSFNGKTRAMTLRDVAQKAGVTPEEAYKRIYNKDYKSLGLHGDEVAFLDADGIKWFNTQKELPTNPLTNVVNFTDSTVVGGMLHDQLASMATAPLRNARNMWSSFLNRPWAAKHLGEYIPDMGVTPIMPKIQATASSKAPFSWSEAIKPPKDMAKWKIPFYYWDKVNPYTWYNKAFVDATGRTRWFLPGAAARNLAATNAINSKFNTQSVSSTDVPTTMRQYAVSSVNHNDEVHGKSLMPSADPKFYDPNGTSATAQGKDPNGTDGTKIQSNGMSPWPFLIGGGALALSAYLYKQKQEKDKKKKLRRQQMEQYYRDQIGSYPQSFRHANNIGI